MKHYPSRDVALQIEHEQVIQDYLDDLSERAYLMYLLTLAEFCKLTQKTPIELLEIAETEQENRTPPRELSIRKWLKQYEELNHELGRSGATYENRVSVIKGFFLENEIDVPKKRHSKRKKSKEKFKIKNKRKALTRGDILEAVDNCRTRRQKAMILTQVSSGLAIADLIRLRLKDYEKGLTSIGEPGSKQSICMFHFEEGRQKTGIEFYTFISFEAVDAIDDYLKHERKPHFKTPYLFTNVFEDRKVSEFAFQEDLRKLNKRLGHKHNVDGLFRPITSHMFRKFFNTQLANTEMSYEARKTMMGHVIPGVDDNYYLQHPDDLKKLYVKYMPVLLVYKYESVNIVTTDEKVQEQDKKIRLQDEKLKRMQEVINDLQKK